MNNIHKLIKDLKTDIDSDYFDKNKISIEIQQKLIKLNEYLIKLCKNKDIFDLDITSCGNPFHEIYIIPKESEYILFLKNLVKENKLDIYCLNFTLYQLAYLHYHSSSCINKEIPEKCGCFNCLNIFSSDQLEWAGYFGDLPVCPYCSIDSIIFENDKLKLTPEILYDLELIYFGFAMDLNNIKIPDPPIVINLEI